MEIITDANLKEIIAKTAGRMPVYINITNGDNTGANPDHPEMYEFEYASPQLDQIDGHISEAFTSDKSNLGVNYFVTTIFRSRNIEPNSYTCSEGTPGSPGRRSLIRLNNDFNTEVYSGIATFDWTVFKAFEMIGKSWNKISCGILVFGKFGGNLPSKFGSLFPNVIDGDLIFATQDHPEAISPDISKINGNFFAKGIKFAGWSPKELGGSNKVTAFNNCKSIANMSSCAVSGYLLLYASSVDQSALPKDVNGNLSIVACNLGKITNLPNVKGSLKILGERSLDFSELSTKPTIGKNLIVSSELLKSRTITKDDLKSKFDIKGDVLEEEDDKIIKTMEEMSYKNVVGDQEAEKFGRLAQAGVETVEDAFGTLGLAALQGIYKLTTGRSMPGSPGAKN